MSRRYRAFLVLAVAFFAVTAMSGNRLLPAAGAGAAGGEVEPTAGSWQTWVLSSGSQFRLPSPPDAAATADELNQVSSEVGTLDATTLDRIRYWDAGAPGYRWDQILTTEATRHGATAGNANRPAALMEIAVYDATIAAWDSKYAYRRPRPARADPDLQPLVATPHSPSYPAEHAVVATAAADVLAYLFPDDADMLAAQASEAGQSRVLAGVQYPSDVTAGEDLGHQVAAAVIAWARQDGSDLPANRTFPDAPGQWSLTGYPDGTKAVGLNFLNYKPWLLQSPDQLRPPPPPAPDSAQQASDLAEVVGFQRTPASNAAAFYWQVTAGSAGTFWLGIADQRLLEERLDADPPRAARVQALLSVAGYDALIACFDAKYTYLRQRPFQADPSFKPLFPTPAHPSYPSAHSCVSGAMLDTLAYFFPREATSFQAE